jgi:hypothetical protein
MGFLPLLRRRRRRRGPHFPRGFCHRCRVNRRSPEEPCAGQLGRHGRIAFSDHLVADGLAKRASRALHNWGVASLWRYHMFRDKRRQCSAGSIGSFRKLRRAEDNGHQDDGDQNSYHCVSFCASYGMARQALARCGVVSAIRLHPRPAARCVVLPNALWIVTFHAASSEVFQFFPPPRMSRFLAPYGMMATSTWDIDAPTPPDRG